MTTNEQIKLLLDNDIITIEQAAELLQKQIDGKADTPVNIKNKKSSNAENKVTKKAQPTEEKAEVLSVAETAEEVVTPKISVNSQAEQQQKDRAFNSVMALMFFAAFLIGLGFIALVAENWQDISDLYKMIGALTLLSTNATIILCAQRKGSVIITKTACVIYACLVMSTIGLIGQIFHLRSDFGGALLFWGALSWPIIAVMPEMAVAWLIIVWLGGENKIWPFPDYRFWGRWILFTLLYEGTELFANKSAKSVKIFKFLLGFSLGVTLLFSFTFGSFAAMDWRVAISSLFVVALVAAANYMQKRVSFMPFIWLGLILFNYCWVADNSGLFSAIYCCLIICGYAFYHKRPGLFKLSLATAVFTSISYYVDSVRNLNEAAMAFIGIGCVLILILSMLRKYGHLLKGEKDAA